MTYSGSSFLLDHFSAATSSSSVASTSPWPEEEGGRGHSTASTHRVSSMQPHAVGVLEADASHPARGDKHCAHSSTARQHTQPQCGYCCPNIFSHANILDIDKSANLCNVSWTHYAGHRHPTQHLESMHACVRARVPPPHVCHVGLQKPACGQLQPP